MEKHDMVFYYLIFRINKLLQPEYNVLKGKCDCFARNHLKNTTDSRQTTVLHNHFNCEKQKNSA